MSPSGGSISGRSSVIGRILPDRAVSRDSPWTRPNRAHRGGVPGVRALARSVPGERARLDVWGPSLETRLERTETGGPHAPFIDQPLCERDVLLRPVALRPA